MTAPAEAFINLVDAVVFDTQFMAVLSLLAT